jgi:hypothetical protein
MVAHIPSAMQALPINTSWYDYQQRKNRERSFTARDLRVIYTADFYTVSAAFRSVNMGRESNQKSTKGVS